MKIGLLADMSESAVNAIEIIKNSAHELEFCFLKGKTGSNISTDALVNNLDKLIKTEHDLYQRSFDDIDLVISFCYPTLIKEPLISSPKYGCINFHPAPLPKYRGFAVYNFGILNSEKEWGVTVHCIDKHFDTGDIIKVSKFKILKNETVSTLRIKSHSAMLVLLNDVLNNFKNLYTNKKKQVGKTEYYSKKKMNKTRKIKPEDTLDKIKQKIRAFWCPPYHGASILIDEEEFTIVDSELLKKIWRKEDG